MATLQRVVLKGFKSIKSMDLELRPVNVLIGANGAGKSNLVSFFSMLHAMVQYRLQSFVAMSGGADSLLFLGSKVTSEIDISLQFTWDEVLARYEAHLTHAAPDRLQFASERIVSSYGAPSASRFEFTSSGGAWESIIQEKALQGDKVATSHLWRLLDACHVYHFHDTSRTARIRLGSLVGDTRWLNPDGSNLAALLHAYQTGDPSTYKRVVSTMRLLLPDFDDFVLEPDRVSPGKILLFWRQIGSEYVLGPHQLSDGTLRAMCLVTLLMQPENQLPALIIVDEPELGLHPFALNVIASLFKKASHHVQVVISTQSSSFLDHFDPEDVIVVNREGKESRFARPPADELRRWLEDYSLGEVWEKNVIGGGPH